MTSQYVFAMPGYERFLPPERARGAELVMGRFGDEELRARLTGSVGGHDCTLIGTVGPPGDSLLGLMLAASTLEAHGAHSITAVLPYLAYGRSDVPEPGGIQSIGVVGRALQVAGVDRAVTVDAHSSHARLLFPVPLVSLSPAGVLGAHIGDDWDIDAVVAPDAGAFPRARELADAIGCDDPLSPEQVAGARCALVVDDIVDTGGTLVRCCERLAGRGVDEIVIAVTHGVFAGTRWRELLSLPVRALYTTDTIPDAGRERPYLTRVVSVVPLVHAALAEPVSALRAG